MIEKILYVSIAFHKPFLIQYQIKLLHKYVKDPYEFNVVDNSVDHSQREEIEKICVCEKTKYFSAPLFPMKTGSHAHGFALNWAYENVVKKSECRYFSFIDHDIFPIKTTNMINKFDKNGMFGVPCISSSKEQQRLYGYKWFLWPGFIFFDRNIIKDIPLDFLPTLGYDTGSANWDILYKKIDLQSLRKMVTNRIYLRDKPTTTPQLDICNEIGTAEEGLAWIHTSNGSCWMPDIPGSIPKETLVKKYLESL